MKAERYRQIDSLFQVALDLAPEKRAAYLDQACAEDPTLRDEVEALIKSYEQAGSFIESPVFERAAEFIADSQASTVVGAVLSHYKIISLLGAGGMGEVYLAEDLRLGRRVALKMLAPDLISDSQAQTRFFREARLASALDHPNICTIHEVGESGGHCFIAMQLVEGKTLKEVIDKRPLDIDKLFSIALQIGDALALAHERDIIHRDIKSHNIIISGRGQAKILDFGLAKLLEPGGSSSEDDLTRTGTPVGTPAYMSPEQARGERADHRSDIFSFGIVMYEMATGRTPFKEKSPAETMNAIINHPHEEAAKLNKKVPPRLSEIIDRALAKDRRDRYQTMRELIIDLKGAAAHCGLLRSGSDVPDGVTVPYTTPPRKSLALRAGKFFQSLTLKPSAKRLAILIVIAAIIAGAVTFLLYKRSRDRIRWAENQIPVIESLAKEQKFFEAFDLAIEAQSALPGNQALSHLMATISNTLTVDSEPSGAEVYLKRFAPDENGNFPERELLGTTPIAGQRIARGDYIIYIEKQGHAAIERTLAGGFFKHPLNGAMPLPPVEIKEKLVETSLVAEGMVFIPGGDYRLVAWRRPTDARVRLGGFLVDKYEVTNREYKEFISAGGYVKKELWRHPFIKNGKAISWEEAIGELKDRTGLAGPRSWTNQNYSEGKPDHPVTDITWHEAAAYAEFRGKRLPTIFEWEKAARNGGSSFTGLTMPWGQFAETTAYRANFKGSGTTPVESFEFGMSTFGCYNMAGNVSEWLLNETSEGFITSGGSWEDPAYLFGYYGTYPAFYASSRIGFRCARSLPETTTDQGAFVIRIEDEVPVYTPANRAAVSTWLKHYEYEKTPLGSQVIEVKVTAEWKREKIAYNTADGKRAIAYLYLPNNAQRPLQVIQVMPAADVTRRFRALPDAIEQSFDYFIKSGRAVFAVVLEGYIERDRPADYREPSPDSVEFLEETAQSIIDVRRGLDYLETRNEIDAKRIALFWPSAGGRMMILPAVEARYSAVIMTGASVRKYQLQWKPEANPINYAPLIRAPKLFMHGRYDEAAPLKTEANPLFKLLSEPKKIVLFDGGHIPGPEIILPETNSFLEKTFEPVKP